MVDLCSIKYVHPQSGHLRSVPDASWFFSSSCTTPIEAFELIRSSGDIG